MKFKRISSTVVALIFAICLMGSLAGIAGAAGASAGVPELTVTSDILGLADTGNKTTLKNELIYTSGPGDIYLYYYNEAGERVKYEDQSVQVKPDPITYTGSAILSLDGDYSKVNIDNAKIELQDSNTTYAEELILNLDNTNLVVTDNGIEFTLEEGALELNNWDYYDGIAEEDIDLNSGREWSMMGGDGNGVYEIIFKISGITYAGQELPAVNVRAYIYIYGRTCTDLALSTEFVPNTYDASYTSGVEATSEIQWNWYTDGQESAADKPYMNDNSSDYFTVIWPEGTDASGITADDVTLTLSGPFGDQYVLSEMTAYGEREYAVVANKGETEIIVTYQQWAYIPVFDTLEISVDNGTLQASMTYTISSVSVHAAQTGGGGVTVEHTVVCQNYTGLSGLTLANAANTEYTLSTVIDGTTYFYVEEDGVGTLAEGTVTTNAWGMTSVSAPANAWKGDATDLYHVAVYNNVLYYETPAEDKTIEKVVDGKTYTFTVSFSAVLDTAEMVARGATLDAGYNLYNNGASKWAWTPRYQAGWTVGASEPTSLPYIDIANNILYGFTSEAGSNPLYDKEIADASGSSGGGLDDSDDDIGGDIGDIGDISDDKSESTTYTVVKGDSLWKIAAQFFGTGTKWDVIFEANRDIIKNSNLIYVGQVLVIPGK